MNEVFQANYCFSEVRDYTRLGTKLLLAGNQAEKHDRVMNDVRQVCNLLPKEAYEFVLQQELETENAAAGKPTGDSSSTMSLNTLVILPVNFIIVPCVVTTCSHFPAMSLFECEDADLIMEQSVHIPVKINESIETIATRAFSVYCAAHNVQRNSDSHEVLSLFGAHGFQHISAQSLRHNELVVVTIADEALQAVVKVFETQLTVAHLPRPTAMSSLQSPPPNLTTQQVAPRSSILPPPAPPSKTDTNKVLFVSMKEQVNLALQQMGIELDEEYLTKLINWSVDVPSVDEYLNVYWTNSEKFTTLNEIKLHCGICMDDHPVENMYFLDCDREHSVCVECLCTQIHCNINPSEDTAEFIPACPFANTSNGCKYVMSLKEVEDVLKLASDADYIDQRQYTADLNAAQKLYFVSSVFRGISSKLKDSL
jgi:hypothetical protein